MILLKNYFIEKSNFFDYMMTFKGGCWLQEADYKINLIQIQKWGAWERRGVRNCYAYCFVTRESVNRHIIQASSSPEIAALRVTWSWTTYDQFYSLPFGSHTKESCV